MQIQTGSRHAQHEVQKVITGNPALPGKPSGPCNTQAHEFMQILSHVPKGYHIFF